MNAIARKGSRFLGLLIVIALAMVGNQRHIFFIDRDDTNVYDASRNRPHPIPFRLEESGLKAGLNHTFECFKPDKTNANILERLCMANAAVAVADLDNTGRQDLFFTTMKDGKSGYLYRNRGDGTFEDITTGSGLDAPNPYPATGVLIFDFDNDGLPDIFVLRAGCHSLYRNLGHFKFVDVSEATGISRICGNATAVNAFDFDKSGYLDLIIGNWWDGVGLMNLSHPIMPASYQDSVMGGKIVLLRNQKGARFEDVAEKMGIRGRHHTWAIGISDLDHDGYPDVFLANDHGKATLYHNDQGKGFTDITTASRISEFGRFGMNAEIADYNNDGKPGIFVSDVTFSGLKVWGNLLWKANGDGTFANVANNLSLSRCGWGWGAKFVDLDRDGWLDLFNTGGYWTGKTKASYYYPLLTLSSLPNFLQADQSIHPPNGKFSHSANNENCVFLRRGERFLDVAKDAGAAAPALGKGVAVVDSANHGMEDIIVTRSGVRPFFYRNFVNNDSNWIGFKLIGTHSNRDAWGASVKVVTAANTQTRELFPANGFKGQSESRIFFGLGNEREIRSVEITWPSGKRETLKGFAINRYQTVKED